VRCRHRAVVAEHHQHEQPFFERRARRAAAREQRRGLRVEDDEVGLLARGEVADAVVQVQAVRAAQGGEVEGARLLPGTMFSAPDVF